MDAFKHACRLIRALPAQVDFHDDIKAAIARTLRDHGFRVFTKFWVEAGDRGGYIALVATRDGSRIAIEVDRRSPRARSIYKLKGFIGQRIIVLRSDEDAGFQIPFIDAVITLPVAQDAPRTRRAMRKERLRQIALS
jgi:hypothetical protein